MYNKTTTLDDITVTYSFIFFLLWVVAIVSICRIFLSSSQKLQYQMKDNQTDTDALVIFMNPNDLKNASFLLRYIELISIIHSNSIPLQTAA